MFQSRTVRLLALVVCGGWLTHCGVSVLPRAVAAGQAEAIIYHGGDILTMAGATPQYVEALAVKAGKITAAGPLVKVRQAVGAGAKELDLSGQTLVPGFVDPHGHMVLASLTLLDANLTGVKDVAELQARMKAQAQDVPQGGWLVGMGYRAEQMAKHRHPTREELDAVSATVPIMISDGSGHHGAINSAMMRAMNLTAETPDPMGGTYYRKPGSQELDGHLAEEALNGLRAKRPPMTPEQATKGVARAVAYWVENGQTTASEMGFGLGSDDLNTVQLMIDKHLLPIDLVMYAKAAVSQTAMSAAYNVSQQYAGGKNEITGTLLAARPDLDQRYINRVRLAGIKFWMDGSLDTALMSEPFTKNPPGVTEPGYKGMRTQDQREMETIIRKYWKSHLQMACHAIGDEANEQYLRAIEAAIKDQGPADHRPIFQHAQLLRPDQIARLKAVGGIPSFTAGGIYPMGDYVMELMGPGRVPWLGPAGSMVKHGITWTINHDMPAGVSPSLIYAMWNVVNRVTKSGQVLAPEERVSPYEALKAITANAAFQIKEEKSKGTLEVGKLADMVVLDKNPLKVEPMRIQEIQVMQTIKEGIPVYTRKLAATASLEPGRNPVHPVAHAHEYEQRPGLPLSVDQRKTLARLLEAAAGE